jgi:glucokinase
LSSRSAGRDLAGIGIACPGPLDSRAGLLGRIGTLPGWEGCRLAEAIQDTVGVPAVLENDADAAALAEFSWGCGRGTERFIYVTVSTGIGAGVILNGGIYRGAGGAHPEIGHLLIEGSGPRCYCGARGCWESLASGSAMSNWMRERIGSAPEIAAGEICAAAAQGEPLALRAVEREAHYLGLGLANLVTAFVPDMITLGGGLMKSSSLFLGRALEVMRSRCTQVPNDLTRVTVASLGGDIGVLGAAVSWLRRRSSP